jgi:transposase-like protein
VIDFWQRKGQKMARKRLQPEEIILKLREVEIQQGKGLDLIVACRNVGITDATYYRWRKRYGGMQIDQAKKYKEMERENSRLKKIVANLSLDNEILKEAARGNF